MRHYSPDELHELQHGDWETAGPIRLDPALPLSELEGAVFFRRVRTFLQAIRDRGGVEVTADGSLDPHFVADLLEPLEWSRETVDEAMEHSRVVHGRLAVDEHEIPPLRVMRGVSEAAGLLERVAAGLRISPPGEEQLRAAAGRLFARLFRAAFRDFDLRALDDRAPPPEPLENRVRALYRIGRTAEGWSSAEVLAWNLIEVREPQGELSIAGWHAAVGRTREELIEPLLGFGLFEGQALPPEPGDHRRRYQFRKTPLFDRFLRFPFADGPEVEPARPSLLGSGPIPRPPTPERDYRLTLTQVEREHLSRFGVKNPDLARLVRLPPVVEGWVTVKLTRDELRSLLWATHTMKGPQPEVVRSAAERMGALLQEHSRGDLGPGDPKPRPRLRLVGKAEPVLSGITLRFTARERTRLRRRPGILLDFPAPLREQLMAEDGGPLSLLFGEAILLLDLLHQAAMDQGTPDIVAHDLFAMLRRLEAEVNRPWPEALPVSPVQRIPIALRQSEAELLRSLGTLPPEMAEALEADQSGTAWRISLTLGQAEQLGDEILAKLEGDMVERLEDRLALVLQWFDDGVDR